MAKVTIEVAKTRFDISSVPAMPVIELRAKIDGAPMPAPAAFMWHFSLGYAAYLGAGRRATTVVKATQHPPFSPVSGPSVKVPFTALRGGTLTATVSVAIGPQRLTATRADILVGGTNPGTADLAGAVPERVLRQLIQHESGNKQFCDAPAGGRVATALNPFWSNDNQGGVGLGQLTNPAPSADDVWNWRANARDLQQRFRANRSTAARLHTRIMASARFRAEAQALNDWRRAEGQGPLHVRLPPLTSDQQDGEALRAYNGFGKKIAAEYLGYIHEYEPAMTTLTSASRRARDGKPLTSPPLLAVDASGLGSWTEVSGAERRRRSGGRAPGDPDYVANVLAQRV